MSARIITALLLTVVLAGGVVSAQMFSAEVAANPVAVGQGVTIKLEASVPSYVRSGCGISAIYKDKPGGAMVYQPLICPRIQIIVGPGGSHTVKYACVDGNNKALPAGNYVAEIHWVPTAGGSYVPHYVPFRIDAQIPNTLPLLATTSPTQRGTSLGITINSANQPNASYVIAAAFTTNKGFQLNAATRIDLDQDSLFWLSLTIPSGPLFQNFAGVLDRTGIAKASMNVPNIAALQGAQLALQGVTLDKVGFQTTNALTRVIL